MLLLSPLLLLFWVLCGCWVVDVNVVVVVVAVAVVVVVVDVVTVVAS